VSLFKMAHNDGGMKACRIASETLSKYTNL
jgi:hypothetical protein